MLNSGTLIVTGDSQSFTGFGESIGYFDSGTFNQTGGVHVVKANMLKLAYGSAASGTYNLSGGSLTTPVMVARRYSINRAAVIPPIL